jgi:hypothetical protein
MSFLACGECVAGEPLVAAARPAWRGKIPQRGVEPLVTPAPQHDLPCRGKVYQRGCNPSNAENRC